MTAKKRETLSKFLSEYCESTVLKFNTPIHQGIYTMKKATKTCGEFNHLFDAQFKPYIFSYQMHASFLDISFLFHYTKKELLPNFDLRDFIKIQKQKQVNLVETEVML